VSAERVVVVAPNWLGDAVMALPAIADLRRHFGGAHLTIAARPAVAPLFTMVPGVDDIVTLPGGGGLRALTGWREDARVLAAGSFHTAVLLPNSFATALVASRGGVPNRWGYATDWRGRLLTRAVPKPRAPVHQAGYYQALTTALGAPPGALFAEVRPDADHARGLLREIGLDPDEPFVAFAPGAAYGRAKQWLPARYAELAGLIVNERGWNVVMVGSPADRATGEEILSRMTATGSRLNRLVDICGRTDLKALAGVLAAARTVVSNDSGAMHLAGAVGARVVAVFGATDERRTSPLASGPDAPAPAIVTHNVFCRPCLLRECPIDHRCMTGVTARAVLERL
jgi:heptosyltransferase II